MSHVLLLANDLMFGSRLSDAAKSRGATLQTVASPAALAAMAEGPAETPIDVAIIDLALADVDVQQVVDLLRGLATPPRAIVAYGPHVHEAKLDAAEAAGCDVVLSRGQFDRRMDEMLARFL